MTSRTEFDPMSMTPTLLRDEEGKTCSGLYAQHIPSLVLVVEDEMRDRLAVPQRLPAP